jgi:hypothetical protein
MTGREDNLTKNHSPDRILVLRPMEGKTVKDTQGRVDGRLFTNENNLHAVMDPQYGHWYFKYDSGTLPEPMQQRFTSFSKLHDYAVQYFGRRNVMVADVKDVKND